MPWEFQPPTPSATANINEELKKASSPPLWALSGWGIIQDLRFCSSVLEIKLKMAQRRANLHVDQCGNNQDIYDLYRHGYLLSIADLNLITQMKSN